MLAKWLVSQENPLTARVFVNRSGLRFLATDRRLQLEDFGVKGERPIIQNCLIVLQLNSWKMDGASKAGSSHRNQQNVSAVFNRDFEETVAGYSK